MLSSCVTVQSIVPQPDEGALVASIERPYETVWKATTLALDQIPLDVVDYDRGYVRSGWITGWGEKKFGVLAGLGSGGSWKRRARWNIWLHPQEKALGTGSGQATAIKIRLEVEERPPAGTGFFRWTRMVPEPKALKDMLREIESRCGL